jgi:hypothetical protein
MSIRKSKLASRTALVDAVAAEVVKQNSRDPFIRRGMYLDKQALLEASRDFDIQEYLRHQEMLSNGTFPEI